MNEQQIRKANDALALVGGVLTLVVMARILLGPDAISRVKMQTYKSISRTAKKGSEILTTIACNADTAYHRCRNVTV